MKMRDQATCAWDLAALGEVMLRLDPGEHRLESARQLDVWEGGGEYNVAQGLAACFRRPTVLFTSLVDNPVGRMIEGRMARGRVDCGEIIWREVGSHLAGFRNGLNFVERGFGERPPRGMSDRGNTAVSQLTPADFDWPRLFEERGARLFHTGGIFVGLSASTPEVARTAMKAAKRAGSAVSFDLNYRESLWSGRGGREAANSVNRTLLDAVDIVFGVPGLDQGTGEELSPKLVETAMRAFKSEYPHLNCIVTTLREVKNTNLHKWGAACLGPDGFAFQPLREVNVLDRIGGGDAFASGFLHGVLSERSDADCLALGLAHGALVMSTPGDTSQSSADEVQRLMCGTRGMHR
jgi:2-dehydro-3-deoxygluconokinase